MAPLRTTCLWTAPGPGIVYKGGIKVHFGGA